MKLRKLLILTGLLVSMTSISFAGPAISVGGGVGGSVKQDSNKFKASPIFSVKGDFQWEKFGVAADFDFNLASKNNWDAGRDMSESLYVTPYINLNAGNFNFNFGPLIGIRFQQTVIDNTQSIDLTSLLFGGTLNCSYKITDHLNAYLELPVIANNMVLGGKNKNGSASTNIDFFYYQADIEISPKIGLTYKF